MHRLGTSFLGAIEAEDLSTYLVRAGWRRREFPRSDLLVFEGPVDDDGSPIEAVFPASRSASDFADRIREVLITLAELESRDAISIAREVLRPSYDQVCLRVAGKSAQDGALPLDTAVQVVRSAHELLVASAATEERPVPYYARATKLAMQHGRSCRFAQTAIGSFVVNIDCPTWSIGQATTGVPFPRRVTLRLMRGLHRLHEALLSGTPDSLYDGYTEGLNGNMCESLLALREAVPDMTVGLSAAFSHALPMGEPIGGEVILKERGFEFINAVARRMRGAEGGQSRDIEGYIVRLAATEVGEDEDLPNEDGDRVATLRFLERGRRQHAVMELEPDQYRDACDAHRDGRLVRVRGTLERVGRRWRLIGIQAFTVVSTPEATS